MSTQARLLARAIAIAMGMLVPQSVAAQVIGTFQWQLQPYCNLLTVVVTQVGNIYTLEGTDNQCDTARRASVTGTAFTNPDGTIGLGFTVVTAPGGAPGHIDATVTLPAVNGTWRDSQGNSGSFVLTPGAGTLGPPRPIFGGISSFTRSANFVFSSPTAFIPLTSNGATEVTFSGSVAGPKVLTFSAECAVNAPSGNVTSWVDIDILHNGVALPPTGGNQDAFCTSSGVAGIDGWIRVSITIVVPAVPGVNSIRILGRLNQQATEGWLSDTSLVIH